jgi:hypothetical protein
VIGNAIKLARVATGEETEAADDGKDAARQGTDAGVDQEAARRNRQEGGMDRWKT